MVFIVFASLGLHPWDVNTIKTSIHPYNQHLVAQCPLSHTRIELEKGLQKALTSIVMTVGTRKIQKMPGKPL